MKRQPPWSDAELNQLEAIAGDFPIRQIARIYNCWASANNYPKRSYYTILKTGYKHNLRFRPIGRQITHGVIMHVLEITAHQAHLILDYCQTRQRSLKSRRYVERVELRRIARRQPELFAMATRANLVQLLEDEGLADWILQHQPQRLGRNRKPIRCVETGQVYPSILAASRAVPIDRNWLTRSIRRGTTAAGFHWTYIHAAE